MSFSSLPEELKLEVLNYLNENENENNLFIYTFNTTQQKVQQKINPVFIKVLKRTLQVHKKFLREIFDVNHSRILLQKILLQNNDIFYYYCYYCKYSEIGYYIPLRFWCCKPNSLPLFLDNVLYS